MVEDEGRPASASRTALAQLAAFVGGAVAGALAMAACLSLGNLLGMGAMGVLAAVFAAPMGGLVGGAFCAALAGGKGGSGAKALGVLAGLLLLVAAVVLPAFIRPAARIDRSRLLGNLKHLQTGVEAYAADDKARRYPATLAPPAFDWQLYVHNVQPDPYESARQGPRLLDEEIRLAPKGGMAFYKLVLNDARPFKSPGTIRYYISGDRSSYALTTSGRDGQPLRRGPEPDEKVQVFSSDLDAYEQLEVSLAALAKSSGDADAHLGAGRALAGLKRPAEAIAQLREAVKLDPRLAPAHLVLARELEKRGDRRAAAAAYGRYLELEPDAYDAKDLRERVSQLEAHQ